VVVSDEEPVLPMGAEPEEKPIERCTVKCDKGSQCTRAKHKGGHHRTEHGCVCFDFPEGTRELSPVSA
jgi:hypothetical protein